jgi:hypothetical protein
MDEQAKINKDVITKFDTMEKILENLDGKLKDRYGERGGE